MLVGFLNTQVSILSAVHISCTSKMDISDLNNDVITRLKTKLRHIYDKYSQIKVTYKYRNVINNLRRNKQLVILKKNKGRGVVLLDKSKYVKKCFSIINRNKFKKLH